MAMRWIAVLVLGAALVAWLMHGRDAKHPAPVQPAASDASAQAAPAEPRPALHAPSRADSTSKPANARDAVLATPAPPTLVPRNPDDPKFLFEAPSLEPGERFSRLAHLAQAGDADAKYFALQIARQCAQISAAPDNQPPQGEASATAYQIELRSRMKAQCLRVTSDAAYPEYAKMLQAHEPELFAERMRQTLQLFFADKGPDEVIHSAVSAISQRPDDATLEMVDSVFADLDIASVYFQPETGSSAPSEPQKRIELTHYALNLLACHYGRPCGPDSYVVQVTCLQTGACLPGADLAGVYQARLLTPQEMAYVRLLLEYLKQFPPNVSWQ